MLNPPVVYLLHGSQLSDHFHFINALESPLSLHEFLAAGNAAGITAMLTNNNTPITGDGVLRHLQSLRCIVNTSAGTDHIDLAECRRRGIAVANGSDVYSDDCADLAVSLLLDVLRKITAGDRFVRTGALKAKGEYTLGNRLSGKRVGIVGMGNIGSRIAKRLEAFGCSIAYTSRKPKQSFSYPFHFNVCELASNVDVLVLCCALTDQTRHVVNKEVLIALGKEGIIINIARGAVVDQEELVRFLVEGKIAGAGFDVFENEPSVPKELFGLDNVVLSPHAAVFTHESFWHMYEHVLANFQAFFSGKCLLSPVGED